MSSVVEWMIYAPLWQLYVAMAICAVVALKILKGLLDGIHEK